MRAVVISAPGQVSIESVPDPVPGPGEVVVKVLASGVCGTDLHILRGEFAPTLPVVPGHEFTGEVVEVGAQVTRLHVGDQVVVDPSLPCYECHYCRRGRVNLCEQWAAIGVTKPGGAAEYARAPVENCVILPAGLSPIHAALTEPVACSVNAFDSLPRLPGDHYLVYGAGAMGLIMARLALTNGGAGVTIVEPRAGRRDVAEGIGLRAVAGADEAPRDGGRGYEVVIDCTGVVAAINDGLPRVAPGGTFLHLGVPAAGTRIEYDAHRAYRHEISIVGSMSVQHSMERAADLLAVGLIDADAVITQRFDLDGYADALHAVRDGVGIKSVVLPHGDLAL